MAPAVGRAAIAVDGNSAVGDCGNNGNCNSLTYSLVVGAAGTNRLVVVGVALSNGLSGAHLDTHTVSSVTYNGVNLTQIGTRLASNAPETNDLRVDQWYLVAPATGTHNVVVTVAGGNVDAIVSTAVSLTGVDQTTPVRASSFTGTDGNGTTASLTVSSAANDMVIDVVCNGSGVTSANAGQTEQWTQNFSGFTSCNNIGTSTKSGASSVSIGWSLGNDYWGYAASSIEPVGSSGSSGAAATGKLNGTVHIGRGVLR